MRPSQMSLSLAYRSQTQLPTALPFRPPTLSVNLYSYPLKTRSLQHPADLDQIALENNVTLADTLQIVRDARKKGLRAPVLLMGYYNPMRAYGEERLLDDCKEAGVNGFILVDLPPEEAISFRKLCSSAG